MMNQHFKLIGLSFHLVVPGGKNVPPIRVEKHSENCLVLVEIIYLDQNRSVIIDNATGVMVLNFVWYLMMRGDDMA